MGNQWEFRPQNISTSKQLVFWNQKACKIMIGGTSKCVFEWILQTAIHSVNPAFNAMKYEWNRAMFG